MPSSFVKHYGFKRIKLWRLLEDTSLPVPILKLTQFRKYACNNLLKCNWLKKMHFYLYWTWTDKWSYTALVKTNSLRDCLCFYLNKFMPNFISLILSEIADKLNLKLYTNQCLYFNLKLNFYNDPPSTCTASFTSSTYSHVKMVLMTYLIYMFYSHVHISSDEVFSKILKKPP